MPIVRRWDEQRRPFVRKLEKLAKQFMRQERGPRTATDDIAFVFVAFRVSRSKVPQSVVEQAPPDTVPIAARVQDVTPLANQPPWIVAMVLNRLAGDAKADAADSIVGEIGALPIHHVPVSDGKPQ